MAINNTAQLMIRGTLSGERYQHSLHFRETDPYVSQPNWLQGLIDSWQAIQSIWLAAHPTAYTLESIMARYVCGSVPLPAPVEEAVNAPGARTDASNLLAPWLSILVRERTNFAGKSYRGRYFVSGGFEADVNGVAVSTTSGTWGGLVQSYINQVVGRFGPSGTDAAARLVIYSPKLASVPGTQCQNSSSLITSVSMSATLTTQKSRRARAA